MFTWRVTVRNLRGISRGNGHTDSPAGDVRIPDLAPSSCARFIVVCSASVFYIGILPGGAILIKMMQLLNLHSVQIIEYFQLGKALTGTCQLARVHFKKADEQVVQFRLGIVRYAMGCSYVLKLIRWFFSSSVKIGIQGLSRKTREYHGLACFDALGSPWLLQAS